MKTENRKGMGGGRRLFAALFWLGLFGGLLVFYRVVHPLYVYNLDDWSFLLPSRRMWPVWGGWNPTRVLPETLMPLVTKLSVWMIYPFQHDFLEAVSIGMGTVMAAAVTIYAACFYRLIRNRYHARRWMAYELTALFIVLHFLVMRSRETGNDLLLAGYYDTTTCFFYLIPGLWNGSLVLFLESEDYLGRRREKPVYLRGLVLAAVYLGLLSNLYHSVILAAYVFTDLVRRRLAAGKERGALKKLRGHGILLLCWLLMQVFEFFGGRSESVQDAGSGFFGNFGTVLQTLIQRMSSLNQLFMLCCAAGLGAAVLLWIRGKNREAGFLVMTGALVLVYDMLVCAASKPSYIRRGDVLIGLFLFIFWFLAAAFIRLDWKPAKIALPLMILIMGFSCMTAGGTYQNGYNGRISPRQAKAVSDRIITQVKEAAADRTRTAVQVHVPGYKSESNWPLTLQGGFRIRDVLTEYEIIDRTIEVEFVIDEALNDEFGV